MTDTLSLPANAVAQPGTPLSILRTLNVFGTGFGLAIANGSLEVVIARSRPSSSSLIATTAISNFASRPASDWGSELSRFLTSAGEPHLAATLVLPREEVIVRAVKLPGVTDKDTAAALELQLDTLHPWDEQPIEWAWWRVSPNEAMVGIVRQSTLAHYESLFSEAGVPMAAVTFSAAVIHAALRLHHAAPVSIFCYAALPSATSQPNRVEVYGESQSKPCYSSGFTLPPDRAFSVARGELRMPEDQPVLTLTQALNAPDPQISPLAWAAALAASAPLAAHFANLLPVDRRATHSRTRYLLPITLGVLVIAALLIVLVILPFVNEQRNVADLTAEQRRLQPAALKVQSIDKALVAHKARIAALDDFRRRPQADLDVLNELVRILPEKAWTSSVEIFPDSVVIAGEADQAAPLLKVIDSSALFQNSEFVTSVTHNGQADQFRIKTLRRGRTGRTTP